MQVILTPIGDLNRDDKNSIRLISTFFHSNEKFCCQDGSSLYGTTDTFLFLVGCEDDLKVLRVSLQSGFVEVFLTLVVDWIIFITMFLIFFIRFSSSIFSKFFFCLSFHFAVCSNFSTSLLQPLPHLVRPHLVSQIFLFHLSS